MKYLWGSPDVIEKYREMERLNNRGGDRTCNVCGETHIGSIFLHRHVCPDIQEHYSNYDMLYLEKELLGE